MRGIALHSSHKVILFFREHSLLRQRRSLTENVRPAPTREYWLMSPLHHDARLT
jgi:hypothetical protein